MEVQGESEAKGPTLKERTQFRRQAMMRGGNTFMLMPKYWTRHSYPISSSSSGLLEATSSFRAFALETLRER